MKLDNAEVLIAYIFSNLYVFLNAWKLEEIVTELVERLYLSFK